MSAMFSKAVLSNSARRFPKGDCFKPQNRPEIDQTKDALKEFDLMTIMASDRERNLQDDYRVARDWANSGKNRYPDILPYQWSSPNVLVREGSSPFYLNGGFVTLGRLPYLLTQAPTVAAFNDFWRAVWDVKAPAIVMLTKMRDAHRYRSASSADTYWPAVGQSQRFGSVTVSVTSLEELPDSLQKRVITIRVGDQVHQLVHFNWINWPDYGCPESMGTPLRIVEECRALVTPSIPQPIMPQGMPWADGAPMVCHCSAGLGRSPVFAACLAAAVDMQRMAEEGTVPVGPVWKMLEDGPLAMTDRMRLARHPAAVQTRDQLEWIYRFIEFYWNEKCSARATEVAESK